MAFTGPAWTEPADGILLVYPLATIDAMLVHFHDNVTAGGTACPRAPTLRLADSPNSTRPGARLARMGISPADLLSGAPPARRHADVPHPWPPGTGFTANTVYPVSINTCTHDPIGLNPDLDLPGRVLHVVLARLRINYRVQLSPAIPAMRSGGRALASPVERAELAGRAHNELHAG